MNKPSLLIIRGLPGSGKSTLASRLANVSGALWYEADMHFMKDGIYTFDMAQIGAAHTWCQTSVNIALEDGKNVIVSNTFTTKRELNPYFDMCESYNIIPQIIICQGSFGSIHSVPEETMMKMKNRFQFDIS